MLPFHSRKEPQRRRKTEEPSDEEGRLKQETREMIPPSATTPSAAIRTKRIARSPPLLVHDDDRKDDFVAKMYFTDDIDGGIELDWCFRTGREGVRSSCTRASRKKRSKHVERRVEGRSSTTNSVDWKDGMPEWWLVGCKSCIPDIIPWKKQTSMKSPKLSRGSSVTVQHDRQELWAYA
ncbi:hypothetical protein EAI_10883 [Harpegnathos saltator]|uniref:Uncharacterized protein n=1 Tax=Harpegnathos saltator TaxID=610380 RepID=E2B5W8_HARSA|nr:hypothetical protein EAI_10883 [Harpegnathos saltator]